MEYKQSTVEKKSPQENISQVENLEKRIVEEQKAEKWVKVALHQLEGERVKKETTRKADQLKNEIDKNKYENLPLQTYNEVVKWTELEQRMLKVMAHSDFDNYPEMKGKSPEQRAEYLFRKINTSISRFYAGGLWIQTIDPVPEYLHKVIVPATEWFLMDILRWGQENNVQFLWELGKMNFENLSAIFNWVRNFSQKFTDVYSQAKKLMMISDFLSLPQQKALLVNLKNPYDFYEKVMKNPIWEQENLDLKIVKMSTFGLKDLQEQNVDPQSQEQSLQQGLEAIRSSIWSIQMVDSNPNKVKKL